jgi:two-component system CheB/CheR fusion protein
VTKHTTFPDTLGIRIFEQVGWCVEDPSTPSPRRCSRKSAAVNAQSASADGATQHPVVESAFAVVGIGASAGGLEALEQFFSQAPTDSGLAFVVVQHLDPTRKSMLVQLLQRATAMPVAQVVDGQTLLPNHIFVIPLGKDLALLHGVLHLMEPTALRGLRLPIDHFLRSLAADLRGQAIGVILSGMGSDGTLGLRAIKENAGAAFVQTPNSAKFDGMPRSAIDAGLADVVAPAAELVPRILAFLHHTPALALAVPTQTQGGTHGKVGAMGDVDKVLQLLREHTGHDFSLYCVFQPIVDGISG